jgi:aryl-alcohol dehydrogenase-like predicted oxidoreductase
MEYRLLGDSGLKVSALCFGTETFGGGNDFFKAWGSTGVEEARRLIGLCLDAGINSTMSGCIESSTPSMP